MVPKTEIVGAKAKNDKVELILSSGKTLLVDFVVVNVGVEPNTELAETSDLEVDPELGGYLVNTELQVTKKYFENQIKLLLHVTFSGQNGFVHCRRLCMLLRSPFRPSSDRTP